MIPFSPRGEGDIDPGSGTGPMFNAASAAVSPVPDPTPLSREEKGTHPGGVAVMSFKSSLSLAIWPTSAHWALVAAVHSMVTV